MIEVKAVEQQAIHSCDLMSGWCPGSIDVLSITSRQISTAMEVSASHSYILLSAKLPLSSRVLPEDHGRFRRLRRYESSMTAYSCPLGVRLTPA